MRIPGQGGPDPSLVCHAAATLASTGFSSRLPLSGNQALHTAVWAVLAVSILALPVAALTRHFRWALILTAFVVCECGVLAVNRGRCPLTGRAARFTEDRAANFDIYLPNWLARNNKAIFGTLFAVSELIVLWRWLAQP